jgi:hypothetical protein
MSCNVDVLPVSARPIVEIECDRRTPVTAASRPIAAMKKMIRGFMRNLLSAEIQEALQRSDRCEARRGAVKLSVKADIADRQ